MRTIRVIPCLDVKGGRVVKGVRFADLADAGDPVELAARYEAEGADEVAFLDIAASHEERATMIDVVAATAEAIFIPLTVGGGVRTAEDARALLRAGAERVSLNTAAAQDPDLITRLASEFGCQCVVLSVDARRRPEGGWEAYTHGGRRASGRPAIEWCSQGAALGAGEILLTSMDNDGTQHGYDLELTSKVTETVDVPVVASGGVGTLDDLVAGATLGGADAVLAASIFHSGRHSIAQAKARLTEAGLNVRPLR
ncbi:MAG: imidazole glycerol phosphate synthase subunit HisF [Acidimicrobiales bacterium]